MVHEPEWQDDAHQHLSATTEDNYKHLPVKADLTWAHVKHSSKGNEEHAEPTTPPTRETPLNLWT